MQKLYNLIDLWLWNWDRKIILDNLKVLLFCIYLIWNLLIQVDVKYFHFDKCSSFILGEKSYLKFMFQWFFLPDLCFISFVTALPI